MRYVLHSDHIRRNAISALMSAELGSVVDIKTGDPRTLEQNALLWVLLGKLSDELEWYGQRLSPEEWKDLLTAGFRKVRSVPNLDGTGFIMLGQRTSQMGKKAMTELIEFIYAFGAEKGVVFDE